MPSETPLLREVRARLIDLLERDRWTMLDQDEAEARATLKSYGLPATQYAVMDFVLELLRNDHSMAAVELTNSKYCPGTGYVMKRPYGYDIYIKLRITDSISCEEVHIMSFHPEHP